MGRPETGRLSLWIDAGRQKAVYGEQICPEMQYHRTNQFATARLLTERQTTSVTYCFDFVFLPNFTLIVHFIYHNFWTFYHLLRYFIN